MPAWVLPVIMAAASAAQQAAAARAASQGRQMSDTQHKRQLGFDESQSNPYREQLSQARSLNSVALAKGSRYTPYRMGGGGSYTDPVTSTGGFSFEEDPRTRPAMDALFESILRGETPARSYLEDESFGPPRMGPRGAIPGSVDPSGARPRPPARSGGVDLLSLLSRV